MQHLIKQEEKEVFDDLKELENYLASDSDSETWEGKENDKVALEWEDFFAS